MSNLMLANLFVQAGAVGKDKGQLCLDLTGEPRRGLNSMTVCIAARSLQNNCVMQVCDMMISFEGTQLIPGVERAGLKVQPLTNDWYALYAGDASAASS